MQETFTDYYIFVFSWSCVHVHIDYFAARSTIEQCAMLI